MCLSRGSSDGVDRSPARWTVSTLSGPRLSATWLHDRMEEVARAGLPQWIQNEFWAAEVDPDSSGWH